MNIYGLCDVCDLIFHGWTANDLFFYELKDLFFCGRAGAAGYASIATYTVNNAYTTRMRREG